MEIAIIQLSDFHYQSGWPENHTVLLDALVKDLKTQLSTIGVSDTFLAVTGDLVFGGENDSDFDKLHQELNQRLENLNIPKSKRICVPGNHDVSRIKINDNLIEHSAIVSKLFTESSFAEYIQQKPPLLIEKFNNYFLFESKFADYGVTQMTPSGRGWDLTNDISIYCLNTSLLSSAGLMDEKSVAIEDKGRLCVDTRSLHKWNSECRSQWKILLMHHPISHLPNWAQIEVNALLSKDFVLCLSGHCHDQENLHFINNGDSFVRCSAPALFTSKKDELGYSIIKMSSTKGVLEIIYRQWLMKHHNFVTGAQFSNTDNGKISIAGSHCKATIIPEQEDIDPDYIGRIFTDRLDKALISYSLQPKIWVEPRIYLTQETNFGKTVGAPIDLKAIISGPQSIIIKAPPQFGLTCLSLYLVKEAWRAPQKNFWFYLDSKILKHQAKDLDQIIKSELKLLGKTFDSIKCVILDSWTGSEKQSNKIIEKINRIFEKIPIIIMYTVDSNHLKEFNQSHLFPKDFQTFYLWSLSRGDIRSVVTQYNKIRHIAEEDSLTQRIVSDITVLNIHRTALNCLTLLKVSEMDFDESPVNRTEMLKRILFLLFSNGEIPTYKAKPDLKDCEYVLGYFCETMLRENCFYFTRDAFLSKINEFCRKQLIDLELSIVFDILYSNNIIIRMGDNFCFRFRYWTFYFAAQRMHHDEKFCDFIFKDLHYAQYPEIIEFYTGIDRKRDDALQFLLSDLKSIAKSVDIKSGLPVDFNLYRNIHWKPSEAALSSMRDEISSGIKASNLPASIKDVFADRTYDRSRPYDQDIREILSEFSFVMMTQTMRAASNALRNSDYVTPAIKQELLQEILKCWVKVTNILILLLPVLSEKGIASFDGVKVLLADDFGDTMEKRFHKILLEIPHNVIEWCKDDLFSQKMGPLLTNQFSMESNDLIKHYLILIKIYNRPRDWKTQVEEYIKKIDKNSFYLCDVNSTLHHQLKYSYASPRSLQSMELLIKMSASKHLTGIKAPGIKAISHVILSSDVTSPPKKRRQVVISSKKLR